MYLAFSTSRVIGARSQAASKTLAQWRSGGLAAAGRADLPIWLLHGGERAVGAAVGRRREGARDCAYTHTYYSYILATTPHVCVHCLVTV